MDRTKNHIYCIGEAIYDIIIKNGKPIDAKVGGALLNTAISLGRCGLPVEYIGDTGDDNIGGLMDNFLQENQVGTTYFTKYPQANSRLAVAFVDKINQPEYVFYKLNSPQAPKLNYPKIIPGDVVVFGSFFGIKAQIREGLSSFLKYARKQQALIIYDPNFRKNHLPLLQDVKPYILENIALSHITKGSDDDFRMIFNSNNIQETLNAISHNPPPIFLYTANKNGIWFHHQNQTNHFEVKEIAPISAIGAGDAFNAGIAYYLFNQGVKTDGLSEMTQIELEEMIRVADTFAEDVCLSFENYISAELAQKC